MLQGCWLRFTLPWLPFRCLRLRTVALFRIFEMLGVHLLTEVWLLCPRTGCVNDEIAPVKPGLRVIPLCQAFLDVLQCFLKLWIKNSLRLYFCDLPVHQSRLPWFAFARSWQLLFLLAISFIAWLFWGEAPYSVNGIPSHDSSDLYHADDCLGGVRRGYRMCVNCNDAWLKQILHVLSVRMCGGGFPWKPCSAFGNVSVCIYILDLSFYFYCVGMFSLIRCVKRSKTNRLCFYRLCLYFCFVWMAMDRRYMPSM